MKKVILFIVLGLLLAPLSVFASLASDLSGMILLQVEENGEAWYVYPENLEKYYLGRPADAFNIMRELGLGIAHETLVPYLAGTFPSNLSGMIMLDVESHGEAYYVYPNDLRGYYLGRPKDAFDVMRQLGLGISNVNLDQINIAESSTLPERELLKQQIPYYDIEMRVFELINAHRESIGSQALERNQDMADIARPHSVNMATVVYEQSHTGFDQRFEQVALKVPDYNGGAENLAWNYSSDPAQQALTWWLGSPGHKYSLENDFYDLTGVGVAKADDGKYYITQLFANIDDVMMGEEWY